MKSVSLLFLLTLPLPAALVGLWEFENAAALGEATVGNDLTLNNANSTIVPVAGLGGTDSAAEVGVGDSFSLAHDIAPNGGSAAYVNEYTIVYDIFLPADSNNTWRSLLQTATTPGGNDGDYFVSTSNTVGVAAINYSSDTLAADQWYRIVFSADIGSSTFGGGSFQTVVIDESGGNWTFNHGTQGLDGRHALYSTANSNIVHFFADDNGEDNVVRVTNLALFDVPLSEAEALQLSTPGSTLQPAPGATLSWTGEESSEWSTAALPGAKNWNDGNGPEDFADFDEVTFADGAFTGNVDISNGNVSPSNIQVDNAASPYVFDGTNSIVGLGGLEKRGGGTLEIRTANSFGGLTILGAGRILLANSDALAGSTVALDATGGALDFGTLTSVNLGGLEGDRDLVLENSDGIPAAVALAVGANNQFTSYSGILSGPGSLIKQGSGVLILDGANTFTSGVTVEAGTLVAGSIDAFGGVPVTSTGGTFEFALAQGVESVMPNDFVLPTGSGLLRMFGSFGPGRTAPDPGTATRLTGLISGGDVTDTFRFGDTGIGGEHDNTTILDNPSNSFVGLIQMWRSTLAFTSDGALGDPDNDIVIDNANFNGGLRFDDNVLLNPNRTVTVVSREKIDTNGFDGEIAGELASDGGATLLKIGAGRLTLSGLTSFAGDLWIDEGALAVTGDADLAAVDNIALAAGADLELEAFTGNLFLSGISGDGRVTGSFAAAGMIAPGDGIGTLTTDSITFDLNVFEAEIDSALGQADRLVVNGDLGIVPTSELLLSDLAATPATLPGGTKLALIEYTGTWDGGTFDIFDGTGFVELKDGDSMTLGPNTFVVDYDDNTDGVASGRFLTLTSSAAADPFASWAVAKITGIDPFAPAGFEDDADNDGISNGLEWILGGDPLAQDASTLVRTSTSAGLVLEFNRTEDAIGEATLTVEWDTDLSGGFANSIPIVSNIAPSGSEPSVTIDTVPSPDRVTVLIPAANAPGGRLFARIVATRP